MTDSVAESWVSSKLIILFKMEAEDACENVSVTLSFYVDAWVRYILYQASFSEELV